MKIRNIITLILISVFLYNCSNDDDSSGPQSLRSENMITHFSISVGEDTFIGEIDQDAKKIIVLTSDIDLPDSVIPNIEFSEGARISPNASQAQNFNNNVSYVVTAENGNRATYVVNIVRSSNKILSFNISYDDNTYVGKIDESSKIIIIETYGLEVHNSIVPDITIAPEASISPSVSASQDFNKEIVYTVTGQNGDKAVYTVKSINTPLSSEKKILDFRLNINNKQIEGIIDHEKLTITLELTNEYVSFIVPDIEISDKATITPDPNENQDFNLPVEYTVVAEDGSSNTYTTNVIRKAAIYYLGGVTHNGSPFPDTKYFVRSTAYVRGILIDLDVQNSKVVLENNINSYELVIEEYSSEIDEYGVRQTSFKTNFPENIITATDYKLKYKINNETIVESDFYVDILSENAPDIVSTNQSTYSYMDTLIIEGSNLIPGLRIPVESAIYQYNESYLSVNPEGTQLQFEMNLNILMFPSWAGRPSPQKTSIILYKDGRYGETIIVDFD